MRLIQILSKRINHIDVRTRSDPQAYQIKGDIEVRFLLKGIFDCNVSMSWKDEYEDTAVLIKAIHDKIYENQQRA